MSSGRRVGMLVAAMVFGAACGLPEPETGILWYRLDGLCEPGTFTVFLDGREVGSHSLQPKTKWPAGRQPVGDHLWSAQEENAPSTRTRRVWSNQPLTMHLNMITEIQLSCPGRVPHR